MLMIETRVLTPDDWRLWRKLRLAALTEAPAAFAATLAEWSGAGDVEHRWRARLENVALNLVLTCEGEPVGMVSVTAPEADRDAELISMWVAPSARGRGVGDVAVRHVLAWVRQEYPGSGVALAVKKGNDHAQDLYRRHGFTDAGPLPEDPTGRLMRR